jgi:hypothetical protein
MEHTSKKSKINVQKKSCVVEKWRWFSGFPEYVSAGITGAETDRCGVSAWRGGRKGVTCSRVKAHVNIVTYRQYLLKLVEDVTTLRSRTKIRFKPPRLLQFIQNSRPNIKFRVTNLFVSLETCSKSIRRYVMGISFRIVN